MDPRNIFANALRALPRAGLVPESPGQMEEDGEVLGQEYHHGRIWSVWSYGSPLTPSPGNHLEKRQRERTSGSLATR